MNGQSKQDEGGGKRTKDAAVTTGKMYKGSAEERSVNHSAPPSLMDGKYSPMPFNPKKKDMNKTITVGMCLSGTPALTARPKA